LTICWAIFPGGLFLIHDRQAEFPTRSRFALDLLFHAACHVSIEQGFDLWAQVYFPNLF